MYKQTRMAVAEKGVSKRTGKSVNSGFTLVELLVVIAIIALLMSILMPALRRVKKHAEEVKCKANMRQVGMIIFMYLQEEDFTMPDFHVIDHSSEGGPGRDHSRCNKHLWWDDRVPGQVRLSPDTDHPDGSYWGTAFNEYVKDVDVFGCPSMRQFAEMLANDLMPGYAGGKEAIQQAAFGLNGYIDLLNTNGVRSQAEVIICTDHVEPRNEQANDDRSGDMFCVGADTTSGYGLSHFRPESDTPVRMDHYRGIFRHNIRKGDPYETGGKAAVLWLDGAVSSIEETGGSMTPHPMYPKGEYIPNRYYDPRGIQQAPYGFLNISNLIPR